MISFRQTQSTKSLIRRPRASAALAQIGEVEVGDGVVQQDAVAGHHLKEINMLLELKLFIQVNIVGLHTVLTFLWKGFL